MPLLASLSLGDWHIGQVKGCFEHKIANIFLLFSLSIMFWVLERDFETDLLSTHKHVLVEKFKKESNLTLGLVASGSCSQKHSP